MFETILRALVERGIRFVVVGGVAATAQGSARVTYDIDLLYDTTSDNLDRLVNLLGSWHAYLRGVERGLLFILDVRALRTTPIMTLTTDVGDIDVMDQIPGVGNYAAAVKVSDTVTVGKARFRALTLEALIASKRAVRRKKDMEHLLELEALLAVRNRQP